MPDRQRPIRVVYFGTPEFAVPALAGLAGDSAFDVVQVVSQPARRAGRGHAPLEPPVKRAADRLGLPCLQPDTLADAAVRADLDQFDADVFVVAAYGRIFGKKTLAIPRHGCLNLHASLLPKYRGASPITAAILNGDAETGVTLMVMEAGLDTGPTVAERRCPVAKVDTTRTLTDRLANIAAELALSAIPGFFEGQRAAIPQPAHGATVVRPLVKADGWIAWTDGAAAIERRVRAMQPWPKTWTTVANGEHLFVLEARVRPFVGDREPGHVLVVDRAVLIACGADQLELVTVQLPGGKPMSAQAALAGRKLAPEMVLGTIGAPVPPPPYERPI